MFLVEVTLFVALTVSFVALPPIRRWWHGLDSSNRLACVGVLLTLVIGHYSWTGRYAFPLVHWGMYSTVQESPIFQEIEIRGRSETGETFEINPIRLFPSLNQCFSTRFKDINIASLEDYRGPDRGFEISLADLIAVSLGFALIATRWREVIWVPTNLLLYGVYLAIACVSFAFAPDQLLAGFTLFKWIKTILMGRSI